MAVESSCIKAAELNLRNPFDELLAVVNAAKAWRNKLGDRPNPNQVHEATTEDPSFHKQVAIKINTVLPLGNPGIPGTEGVRIQSPMWVLVVRGAGANTVEQMQKQTAHILLSVDGQRFEAGWRERIPEGVGEEVLPERVLEIGNWFAALPIPSSFSQVADSAAAMYASHRSGRH